MINYCPFFPNEVSPCDIHSCSFRCSGGCAISLAAYSHDTFRKAKEINDKVDDLNTKLNNIEYGISDLKQRLK